jgi:hypothetical protein
MWGRPRPEKSGAKSDTMMEEAKTSWLTQIKEFASSDVMSVQADRKVIDHVDDLMSWKIDFIVVKGEGKVIQGVVGRDQLNDIINEKKLETRNGTAVTDLRKMSFRDILESEGLREYYVINEDAPKSGQLWLQGLPAREILIIKDKIVKAVVDRRWFKKWQSRLGLARSL